MALRQAGGEIAGIGRWVARDKRGRVMVRDERLRRRPQWIEARAEIQHARRRCAAMRPVDQNSFFLELCFLELHLSSFITKN